MKSLISAVAAAACLALAPVAQAQVSCADMQRTVYAALLDFDDIIGEELDDFSFATTFELPGATSCTIAAEWDSLYQCLWVHDSREAAEATFSTIAGTAAACFPAWSPKGVLDDLPLPDTAVMHAVRSGSGEYQDMEVLIHLNRFEEAGQIDWEVWYEVIYYLL